MKTEVLRKREIVGLVEKVKIEGKEVLAKIDTGANRSSIDINLAAELKLGPIIAVRDYTNVHGKTSRVVLKAKLEIKGRKFNGIFNIMDRKRLKYRVLLGDSILKKGKFIIDPLKK
ncbi:ATP-dependent zinc protease [Candidatus Woesearchaeota archaeon]|nr:ATP-dependent zinc protease [Candidatus Woesearchaeota archaeon]